MTQHSGEGGLSGKVKRGRIFKKSTGQYSVHTDGEVVICSISNRLRKALVYPAADPASIRPHVVAVKDIKTVDPVAIGDVVCFVDGGGGTGMITEILPRKSKLSRPAAGRALEQAIVANVDQVVPVFAAARPKPNWGVLDRYLASAESAGLPALICITKLDLGDEDLLRQEMRIYEEIGYGVILTSAMTGRGIEALKHAFKGRVSVLVGKSGVGKTTLLNAIQPGLGLRVSAVGRSGEGRHVTSHLEMFELDFGGNVTDTPGMRVFGLWDITGREIARLFPEMRPYIGLCRFGMDCSHSHEPGCAIKEAVEAGEIARRRYGSYLRMKG